MRRTEGRMGEATEISFRVRGDAARSLARLLGHCRRCGQMGHSFRIVADPDNSEYREEFGFDGDGSDKIEEITVDGEPLPEDFGKRSAGRLERIAGRLVRGGGR